MKTYLFEVVLEEEDDGRWSAHCPALLECGAATWGNTKKEAIKHIQEVVQIVVDEMISDGDALPIPQKNEVRISEAPLVSVTV